MNETVGIVGGGSIGVAFAVLFAKALHPVVVQDPDSGRRDAVLAEVRERLVRLQAHGLLDQTVDDVVERVRVVADVEAAVHGAALVQECAPEQLDLKRDVLSRIDRSASPDAVLASSSSFIPISSVAEGLQGRSRCLVAHPGNPPYLIPVVELVPAPFTADEAVRKARRLYAGAGMTTITLGREIEGFVFNRLQGALLREAYRLVRDGVASVEDVDAIVRDGLGMRLSVIGPFETADLNTRGGIVAHAAKMGPSYRRMGAQRGEEDAWTDDLVEEVNAQRRRLLPLSEWDDRVAWRDDQLMATLRRRLERVPDEA